MSNVEIATDDMEKQAAMAAKALDVAKIKAARDARKGVGAQAPGAVADETKVRLVVTTELRPWAQGKPMEHNQIYEIARWEADLIAANGHGVIIPEGENG